MPSLSARWRQPKVRQSIRTRLLLVLLGLTTVSVLTVGYLGINSVQSMGKSAQQISAEALRTQAEEHLRQVTVDEAKRNDLVLTRAQRDAENVAQYAAGILKRTDVFTSANYWQVEEHMFVGDGGQYMNDESDVSDAFVPNLVDIDDEVLTTLELSAFLDFVLVPTFESDPNTVAIYLGTERDVLRYYPNINIGTIVPPDFQVTQRPWYLRANPENNPERAVVWSSVYTDATGKGYMVTAAAPVYVNGDEFIGNVGIDVTLQDISASIEESRVFGGGYSLLIDDTGHAIVLSEVGYPDILGRPAEPGELGADLSAVTTEFAPVLAEMLSGSTGFATLEVGGRELLVAYAPLESTGWSLANIIEADQVLQAMVTLQEELQAETRSVALTRILLVGAGILVAVVVFGLVLTNRLTDPIQKLATAAQQIGAGQWDVPLPEAGDDEMGILSEAFATMTAQLRTSMQDLEQRVAERTHDLERQTVQMQTAAEVAREATALRDVDQLLDETVRLISERFGFYHAGVFLMDDRQEYAVLQAASSEGGRRMLERGHKLAVGKVGMVGYVTGTGEARITLDVGADATHFVNPNLPKTRSEITLPLRVRGEVIGALDVQSTEEAAFSDQDVATLGTMADQLAIALDNARLFQEVQDRLRELNLLYGEYSATAWAQLSPPEHPLGYVYDRIDVTPMGQLSAPALDLALQRGEPVTIVEPEAALVMPLKLHDQIIGALGIQEMDEAREWSSDEVALVEAVSEQVALALESARLFDETRRRTEELALVNRIVSTAASSLDSHETLDVVAAELIDTFSLDHVGVTLLNKERTALTVMADRSKSPDAPSAVGIVLPLEGNPSSQQVIATRRPLVIPDAQHNLLTAPIHDVMRWRGTQTLIILPLIAGGEVIGTFGLDIVETDQTFTPDEMRLAETIVAQASTAIQNAQLFEQTRRRAEEQQGLARVAALAGSTLDLDELLGHLVDETVQLLGAEIGVLLVLDEDEKALVDRYLSREARRRVTAEEWRVPLDSPGFEQSVFSRGGTYYTNHARTDPNILPVYRSYVKALDADNFCGVALRVRDRSIGELYVGNRPGGFGQEEAQLLRTVTGYITNAIENARLFEQTQEALTETEALYRASWAIGAATSSAEVGQALMNYAATSGVDAVRVLLFEHNDEGQPTQMVMHEGWTVDNRPAQPYGTRLPMEDYPLADFMSPNKPVVVEDVLTDERANEMIRTLITTISGLRSFAMVPITVGNRWIGTIFIGRDEPGAFAEELVRSYWTLAGQAAAALDNLRLLEETRRHLEHITTLYEIGQEITSTLDLNSMLQTIADDAARLAGCHQTLIALLDAEKQELLHLVGHGYGEEHLQAITFEELWHGLTGWVMREKKPTLTRDMLEDERETDEARERSQQVSTGSVAVAPLMVKGRVIGTLTGVNPRGGAVFTQEDVDVLVMLASQAAIAIENVRLFEESRIRAEELVVLNELSQALTTRLTVEGVLEEVHRGASRLLDTTNFYIGLYDAERNDIRFAFNVTSSELDRQITVISADEGFAGYIVRHRTPVLVQENLTEQLAEMGVEMVGEFALSYLGVPLLVGDRVLGVMAVQSFTAPRVYDEHDRDLLSAIAGQTAIALQNAYLFEETQQSARQWEALTEVGRAIGSILDLDQVLRLILERLKQVVPYDSVSLWLREGEMMRVHAVVGFKDREGVVGLTVPIQEDALFQELVHTRQSLTIADVQRDERFRGLGGTEWVRSWLGVPLLSKGQVTGLLTIDKGDPGFYTAERAELAFAFGQQASMAIENARLFEETQRRAVQLAVASEVARDAIGTLDVDQLLDETVRLISERFGFYHAGVFLVDEEREYAVLRAASSEGGRRMLARGHKLEVGRAGMVGYVTATGEPRIALDVGKDTTHFVNPDLPETRSEMTLPLRVRGEVIGALDVQSTEESAFTDEDVAVLQTMADQLANAIANARLFAEVEQTAERLKELDRLKSQFLANMSHELRTPLNSVIGFSRVMLKGIDGPLTDLQRTDLQAIYESGQHLLGLINDVLDISKIEAGKMELIIEDVDLREIIKGVMSTAIALVKDKPIKLQQTIAPGLPTVRGDVRRIREIFLNLVANAAKFTEEGFIHLTAEATPAEVLISVSDSGIGIPPDKMDIIFEPFTQVDASSTRRTGGTGLGLSISKHFVEMHDGRLWAESTFGEGSTFYFTLPIEPLSPALVEEKPRGMLPIPETKPGQKLVLCVDDDEGVITLFRRYLGKVGYQVTGLTDGIAVVEQARQLQPFAITLDVLMPNKDGWQIIQELDADPETRHIPVIMCTIMSEEERGLSLGASDYLVKPILEQDLLAALERLDQQAGRHRVLVVDDQPEDRHLLRRMIENQEGYEVVEAAGGQEAIDLIRQVWPHVIVLDLMMPEVDGFAVLEAVKADETTRSIPIIVVTAKDLSQSERDILDSRVETWLQKSLYNRQELLADVAAALKRLSKLEIRG